MLSAADYEEAVQRYKNMKLDGHERQRCHALILVQQEYSYREIAAILLVDERTVSRWVEQYETSGLPRLQNDPQWGGGRSCVIGNQHRTAYRRFLTRSQVIFPHNSNRAFNLAPKSILHI